MDTRHPQACAPKKEEAIRNEQFPLLAAYRDDNLSTEAAEELVRLTEDALIPAHTGEDLPRADKVALLRKAEVTQKGQCS